MADKPCDPKKGPCNVTKGGNKTKTVSFFQRTGKYVILFIIIGIAAVIIATISVTVNVLFGGTITIMDGYVYTDLAVIISFIIGLVITPIIILYVMEQRKKTMGI